MSDRGILFLFSCAVIIASLGAVGWLFAAGQADTVDGLFLLLTCLLTAFAFGLFVVFMVRRAMESLQPPAPKPVKSAAAAPKPALATAEKATETT